MKKAGLNQAQREIAASERAFWNRAVNTVSVRLVLEEYAPPQVKEAAEAVFASSDLFAASLILEDGEFFFIPEGRGVATCGVLPEMERGEALREAEKKDKLPLGFPEELYEAVVIPLKERGAMLYARFHHILIDGYGMCLFAQKVLDRLAGKAIEKSVFFTDDFCQGASGKRKGREGFWREFFADAKFAPAIFPDTPDGMKLTRFSHVLESGMQERVACFAKENGVTVPYVFAGAYALCLSQAAGTSDAVFLMPRLNRLGEEMQTLGCYTLLVPVVVRIGENDTFAEVCKKAQRAARQASAQKDCGFGRILKELRGNTPGSGAISEYVLNYYLYQIKTKVKYSMEISVAGEMRNHFTWNIFQTDGNISFAFDGRKGVYDVQKTQLILQNLTRILNCGMAGMAASEIPALGERERELLFSIKGREVKIGKADTIPSLFQAAAKRYKDRPALYAGKESYTFFGLDEASNAVACGLARRGAKNGDFVAFMLKRDARLIPVLLGIAKTGAAFVPIDPAYPKERTDFILKDSGAKFLVSAKNVEAAAEYEYLDADELLKGTGALFCPREIRQEQAAYLIYTSGTTGRPKGVILSHEGIANITHPENNPFNKDIVKNGKGIVAIGSVCFDISLFEIFVPLFNGLFVELGNEKAMFDAGELAKHVLRHGADILHVTPSRIVSYFRNPDFTEAIKQVQAILFAGEILPQSLLQELKRRCRVRVYNGYGPTETTIGATITEAGDGETIGRPIANTGILILNANKKLAPYGAAGEICIYGKGVGIGYLGREKETEEKFICFEGIRMYRTGDLGCLAPDGRLVYHGRLDRQVKLRGLRIELSEIETAMGSFRGISQAACIVRKTGQSGHLIGFFTTEPGHAADIGKLREFLEGRLPSYMVPDILKELDEMPQTHGGKTDLKALAEIPFDAARPCRMPESEGEIAICRAFSLVLGLKTCGIDDNFFELGGDSLSVVELVAAIEKELGRGKSAGIDYASVFKYPSPALLAGRIGKTEKKREGYALLDLDYAGIGELLSKNRNKPKGGRELGNVLLTGATGYLGIHILMELLGHPDDCGKIFCLVRTGGRGSALRRMKRTLFYYAETDYAQSYGTKWVVVEGDIADPWIFQENFSEHVDTVINSAANVSHFMYGDALERVNLDGVKHLIDFALPRHALFCQISTISVSGTQGARRKAGIFTESDLYVGQNIFNQYIYSKYMAEHALLRAAVDQGLAVKIMRVGNLQGRSGDGEFQMNLKKNAFTRQLSSYIKMHAVPESAYRSSVNFTPVDETAHMICALAKTDLCHSVFHVYPPWEVEFSRLFEALGRLGYHANVLEDEQFEALLRRFAQSDGKRALAEGLLTERPDARRLEIPASQELTERLLSFYGERWMPVTEEYLERYLAALAGMDLFSHM